MKKGVDETFGMCEDAITLNDGAEEMKGYIRVTPTTDLEAMCEVLNTLEMTNNGYIFNMENLSKAAKGQLPAMAEAGLVVMDSSRVYTPESYAIHRKHGQAGDATLEVPGDIDFLELLRSCD